MTWKGGNPRSRVTQFWMDFRRSLFRWGKRTVAVTVSFGKISRGRKNSTHRVENVEMIPVKTIYFRPFIRGYYITPLISIVGELYTIDSMENQTSWAPGHVGSDGTSATTSSSSICSHCSIMMAPQFGRFYYHHTHVGRQRKKKIKP